MTERWSYIVALPLADYYNEEMWWRVFPPDEDDEEMAIKFDAPPPDFDAEAFQRMLEKTMFDFALNPEWITAPERRCPECRQHRQPIRATFNTSYKPRKPDDPT